MFRKLITLALALAAALTLMVSGPTTANAAPNTTDGKATTQAATDRPFNSFSYREQNFLRAVNNQVAAKYTRTHLVAAGHYACSRKDAYGLRAQIGLARTRIIQAVNRDVNRAYFGSRNATAAESVTRATGALGGPILSLC